MVMIIVLIVIGINKKIHLKQNKALPIWLAKIKKINNTSGGDRLVETGILLKGVYIDTATT